MIQEEWTALKKKLFLNFDNDFNSSTSVVFIGGAFNLIMIGFSQHFFTPLLISRNVWEVRSNTIAILLTGTSVHM